MEDKSKIKLVGAGVGLIIGLLFVWQGFWGALIVGLLIVGGFFVGKYVAGEFPVLDEVLQRFASRNRRPRD
jgi:uncharacterized membrane protein